MHSSFALVRAVIGLGAGLLLASLHAAEPPHPLMGATREQVLSHYGEPKGQIAVGSRLVLTYPRERLVLRNDVVTEVEILSAEPVRRPAPPPVEAAPVSTPAPAAPATDSDGAEKPPAAVVTAPVVAAPVAPAPEPKFEIKLVRPPSAGGAPSPKREAPAPVPVVEAPKPVPVVPAPEVVPEPPKPDPAEIARAAKAAQAAAEAAAQEKRLKSAQSARRRLDFAETAETDDGGAGRNIAIGLGVLVVGIGVLVWWRRQRSLELAATSVASTPVKKTAPVPAPAGTQTSKLTTAPFVAAPAPGVFSPELLARLDASRFEELVAAYFVKTGVVATRTKTGAASPVHLRISWKGEPRAFACAHCIAQGGDAIEARALHGFAMALAAEDLRRGYVVTSGRFAPAACDFAAAKHLTLMPVDVLLEKIAGLPEAARKELLQIATAGKQAA